MKYVIKGLLYLFSFVVVVLSLVMIFFETRLLLSGDWLLSSSPANAFIRYFLRLILSFIYLSLVLVNFVQRFKNKKIFKENQFYIELSLLAVSIMVLIFCGNFEGIVIFLVMLFYVIFERLDNIRNQS